MYSGRNCASRPHANVVVVKPLARSLDSHGSLQHTSFPILHAVVYAFLCQPELEARDPIESHQSLLLAVGPCLRKQAIHHGIVRRVPRLVRA
jgi:hypothetical protein